MFLHNYLPCKLMEAIIVLLIIKNKNGLITDKDSYRPIAITNVVSKILELLLLDRLQFQLETSSNQLGFKNKHGTDMCVYTLKLNSIINALVQYIFVILMLQKHLIVLTIGVSLRNLLNEILMLL